MHCRIFKGLESLGWGPDIYPFKTSVMEAGMENEGSLTCVFLCFSHPPSSPAFMPLWGSLLNEVVPRIDGFLGAIGLFWSLMTTK